MKNLFSLFGKIRRAAHNCLNLDGVTRDAMRDEIQKQIREAVLTRDYERLTLESTEMGVTEEKTLDRQVIVSLTSYGIRVRDVCLTVESLMRQTVKPNRIILWLAGDEFAAGALPITLRKQQTRGLTIDFCEDTKSYKKLIPSLRKYPDDLIITVDDDILYQADMIENLLVSYKEHPEYIHFYRGWRMRTGEDGRPRPYNEWLRCPNNGNIDHLNFPTSGGGTLFPPHSLHEEVFNQDVFMDICPTADDVWFKAMALLKGTLPKKVSTRDSDGDDCVFLTGPAQTENALYNINRHRNDEQIDAVFSRYDLYSRLGGNR